MYIMLVLHMGVKRMSTFNGKKDRNNSKHESVRLNLITSFSQRKARV